MSFFFCTFASAKVLSKIIRIDMGNTRVFISSVQSEFLDERRRIAEYIRHDAALSRFFEPFLFEELPAQDKSAQMAYMTEASKSGIYMLLVGERYGYEDVEGVSPTEREYDAATANHAYRIAFIKNTDRRETKEEAFKQRIDADVIRNTFSTYEELQSGVYASLVEYMMSHHMLQTGPWDSAVCLNATMDDLDKEKIRWFVGLAREKRRFPLQYSDEAVPQILQSLHLLTDKGELRNAAMLLFAKDPQRWFVTSIVKCAHFYGTKKTKPIASLQQYGGSVFEMVDLAVSFVMSRIDQRVGERTHSAEVDVTPELPAQAVTEAIVNAVVHRDYTSNGSVQVMLFKDRLEVWNPGRLPQGMTIEKIQGEHESRPVNPVLANPVYLTGYIEQMGTGTTDIIALCEKHGLRKPEFIQEEDFRTIIWRPETTDDQDEIRFSVTGKASTNTEKGSEKSSGGPIAESIVESIVENLSAMRARIVWILWRNPKATAKSVSQEVGIAPRNVQEHFRKLQDMGIIRRSGGDFGGHWEILTMDR